MMKIRVLTMIAGLLLAMCVQTNANELCDHVPSGNSNRHPNDCSFAGKKGISKSGTNAGSRKDYPVSLFDIRSGGTVLNTRSIQYAMDYISEQGGGRLVFSTGSYLTGAIHLKSNVTIQLDEGAVLLGSTNPLDYDRQQTAFDHNFQTSLALILGLNQHNVAITGRGTIDGQGKELAANVGEMLRKGFIKGGSVNRPDEDQRPMLINLFNCDTVAIKNITLRNSACWVQCYNQCINVTVDSIQVESRAFWNNDGIDIVDCSNFTVSNSSFNCSDDGICLKSLVPGKFNQHIRIRNNKMTTEASGVKFGTASLGGFKDVHVINNTVYDTYRSAIALEAVDGAVIDNIVVDSMQGINIGNGIFLRAGSRKGIQQSQLQNVTIRNMRVEIRAEKSPRQALPPIIIAGLPGLIISNVSISNVFIRFPGGAAPGSARITIDSVAVIPERPGSYPEYSMFGELPAWGVYIRHARNIQFSDLTLQALQNDYRTAIVLDDVQGASFKKMIVKEPQRKKKLFAHQSSNISF